MSDISNDAKVSFVRKGEILPGYPPEFNEEFKRYIRKRDNYRCAVCNQKRRMDVHHIDYIKKNTNKLNCISLCRDCHKVVHACTWMARVIWKNKFWDIARKRETNNDKFKNAR